MELLSGLNVQPLYTPQRPCTRRRFADASRFALVALVAIQRFNTSAMWSTRTLPTVAPADKCAHI